MDQKQIELIRSSWLQLKERNEPASQQFYQQLFASEPELRVLFKGDLFEQGRKLMMMLNAAIVQLDNLPQLALQLQQLGQRHLDYGVVNTDYDAFERNLLFVFSQNLGSCFNPETQQAWQQLLTFIRQQMQSPVTSEALSA